MNNATWRKYFKESPDTVQFYLLRPMSGENEDRAQDKLAYDDDAWARVMNVVWELIFEHTIKSEFREKIKALSGDRKPDDVERELLLNVVLPLADLVTWDVDERLRELGVSSNVIESNFRVSLRPVSYGAAGRRIATLAKISVLTEEIARKLRELLVSYIKKVRSVEQVKEVLQRNQQDGGLGFTKEQADSYAQAMDSFLDATEVLSEQEYADWYTQFQREANMKPSENKEDQPEEAAATTTDEDTLKPGPETIRASQAKTLLERAIQETLTLVKLPDLDEYMQKRLHNVISTRLRDVRNNVQVKELLARDPKVGGLGLETAEVERVATVIETVYTEQRTQISGEEKQNIDQIKQEQQVKIEERKKRESEEHAKWYQEKVKDQTTESWQALRALREQSANAEPISQSSTPTTRPVLDDVQAPVRLSSLTDELAHMQLEDFRRLAKTPDQIVQKLSQKFDLLKQESFEHWTDGIQAWKNSPLQQMYLKLVADSFANGKPVAELVEERRKTDLNLPTAEELGAILMLNNKIRI